VSFLGVEFFFHLVEDLPDGVDVKFAVMLVEDLDEAAHVGAPESVGEVYEHGDGADGVLDLVGPVPDGDGITEILNSHPVDGNFPGVELVLNVYHGSRFLFMFCSDDCLHVPPGVKVAYDFHPAGLANGDQVFQDLVHGFLVEEFLLPELVDVELDGFELQDAFVRDVFDVDRGEVGITRNGAEAGEFREGDADFVVPVGILVLDGREFEFEDLFLAFF